MQHSLISFLKTHFGLILIILLSFIAIWPFFHAGFFSFHDNVQVERVYEMSKALQDGMFPVRWVADLGYGYGYPIFNFYAPFAYYVGGFINLLVHNSLLATKMMMATGIVLAGFSMYLLGRALWGEWGGLVSGVFYLFATYHAVEVYVRGDTAEFWAYALIPLLFYACYQLYRTGKWRYVIWGSLSYAALICSHNLTAMMVTPFLLLVMLILFIWQKRRKKQNRSLVIFLILVLGICLSAFYWLPVLTEMQYTNVLSQVGRGADYKDHFVCLSQLWNSPWGFGGSAKGCLDGMSFKIGKISLLMSGLVILLSPLLYKKYKEQFWAILISAGMLASAVFLMLPVSQPLWDSIHPMAFFQYPWRFLILATCTTALLSGGVAIYLPLVIKEKRKLFLGQTLVAGLGILAILVTNVKYFKPQEYMAVNNSTYTNISHIRWDASRISDEYLPSDMTKPHSKDTVVSQKLVVEKGDAVVQLHENKTQDLKAGIHVQKDAQVLIQTAPFPAWHVLINNVPYEPMVTSTGLIVSLPKGRYNLEVRFQPTLTEHIATLVSLVGLILLALGLIRAKKNHTL